jgi:hypothetical protein
MPEWIFIEDRDFDTGHGWRDDVFVTLNVDGNDGDVCIYAEGEKLAKSPFYSYAWICRAEHFDQEGYLEDNIRRRHVLSAFPGFPGEDDMGSHFEFQMSPQRMREVLLRLGLKERKFPARPAPTPQT